MKKSSWFRYGFYNFYLYYFIGIEWGYSKNSENFINKCYSFKDVLKTIIFLVICTLINLVIYKLVTIKHKLSKKYFLIPFCVMLLGVTVGILLGMLKHSEYMEYIEQRSKYIPY